MLDFTHGHPLALSLVADVFAQRGDFDFHPEAAPDVVKALLEDLVQKVPGPAHRTALEACALVRLMTEDLLDTMLTMPDTHELFEWLRGLSFMEAGPIGLFPHDLAREALAADLRWRNPAWYAELHRRARNYYLTGLQKASERDQQRILFDYVFLHRDNPVMQPFFEWQESGSVPPDRLRPADREPLIAMVERFEGPESAAIAAHWLERQPEGAIVFRDLEGAPTAFMLTIALEKAAARGLRRRPGGRRPLALRADSRALAARRDRHRVSLLDGPRHLPVRLAHAEHDRHQHDALLHDHARPGVQFLRSRRRRILDAGLPYSDQTPIPEIGFVVGGRRYTPFGHNWRAVPPLAWLALLAEREVTTMSQPPPPRRSPRAPSSSARTASPKPCATRYATSPASTRCATTRSCARGSSSTRPGRAPDRKRRLAALQALVTQACRAPGSRAARRQALPRAPAHVPAPGPHARAAAEQLDLPFSTYRRHLKSGVTRVAAILWQWEIQGAGA